jgi:hypothetical protein
VSCSKLLADLSVSLSLSVSVYRDNSGTMEWGELHLALKEMSICCTDEEVGEMFRGLGLERDEHIHFEEFVSIIRSKAATGTIFHGEKTSWCLDSFFGVGDTIGFQVDTIKGVAQIFKNQKWLGQAFKDLPGLIYPFVSLSNAGMSATIVSEMSKSLNSKSDLFVGGYRKPWNEGSEYGAADRIGFLVDMDNSTCDIYKNGESLGRAFERLPPNLFPFATLCHSGAKACLTLPPQPNPFFYDHLKYALERSKYFVTADIPCTGGTMNLSETGTPCAIQLQVLEGGEHQRGDRRFIVRACDIESLFDCDVLGGVIPARIVSPIVHVIQISGPVIDVPQTRLSIPHCCSRATNLKLVFMPLRTQSAVAKNHCNVWAELDATWSRREGTCSISSGGIFCILCLDDPVKNPDLVYVEYKLVDPTTRETESVQEGHMVDLDHLPGAREPKFCCVKLGTSLHGTITIRPISALQVPGDPQGQEAIHTPLPRGSIFEPLTAIGADEFGLHHGVQFSDTECFATSGCALWLQSTYTMQKSMTGARKLARNPGAAVQGDAEPDDDIINVRVAWRGVMLQLPFRLRTAQVVKETNCLQEILSKRMDWNPLLAEYNWVQFRYLFDPTSGTLFEGPKDSRLTLREIAALLEMNIDKPSVVVTDTLGHTHALARQGAFTLAPKQRLAQHFKIIGQLPRTQFEAGVNPESLLRYLISLTAPPSEDETESQEGGGKTKTIVLSSGRKLDRDSMLCSLRSYVALQEQYRSIQQILVTTTLLATFPVSEFDDHVTSVTFSPLTLTISHGPIKHVKKL